MYVRTLVLEGDYGFFSSLLSCEYSIREAESGENSGGVWHVRLCRSNTVIT